MEAKNLIQGFIAGAALGVAAGLLLAPASGEKTRSKLVKGSLKLKKNVIGYVDDSIENLREQVNEKIDKIAKRGAETINQVREKVRV